MMNSIEPILNNYLPMSFVLRKSLLTILENVVAEQSRSKDRLSLAIPMDEIISYYESRLLRDVITVEQGLVMRIANPPASKQTAFHSFSFNSGSYAPTGTGLGNQMEIRSATFSNIKR